MFYRYEIKNNGLEDVLYLYLTMNYEFSRELGNSSTNELERRTTNFIQNNGISFSGNKVYLVINDIIVKAFHVPKEEEIKKLKDKKDYDDDTYMVSLKLEDQSIIEISLKEFLLGALATNMVPNLSIEVLKAMAVLYRTYAFQQMRDEKVIQAINPFFVYKHISYYKIAFAPDYDQILASLEEAIRATKGMFLHYKDDYILPFIHICNFGKTLEDKRYPYLSSVSSIWDLSSPFYVDTNDFSYEFLSKVFHFTITKDTSFKVLEVSPYGKVLKLEIAGNTIDGEKFMKKLHLKSQFLSIVLKVNSISIITHGWGNALGLSLYGACNLADNGCSFANILEYYFPKVHIFQYEKELSS